jgi:uncharacterized protein DUF3383
MTLSVNDVVVVTINMSPTAAAGRNFSIALILGDSNVIDVQERWRLYGAQADIATTFGAESPEALAAEDFFGQDPSPTQCYVGRWASTATSGLLRGASLTAAEQALTNFTTIANGGMNLVVNGSNQNLSGLNFTAQTNLNGVASVVTTALAGAGTVTWDSILGRFTVASTTTGSASTVSFASTGAGTDVSHLFQFTQADGAYTVAGQAAELYADAVALFLAKSSAWYGLNGAYTVQPTTQDLLNAAKLIESASASRVMGVTSSDQNILNPAITTDIASILKAAALKRSLVQYSSTDPYASVSILGRAFTVDFDGVDTTLTIKFQQEPGVQAEDLNETQGAAVVGKNANVFAEFDNDTSIIMNGTMANGFFFDEVHGTDWLQNAIQTACFNALYTAGTKVPQTDGGVTRLLGAVESVLDQADQNGLVAPGVWTGPAIGPISTGQTLSKGYFVFAQTIADQSQADRDARKAPPITALIKLAGAIHSANIIVNVNR